MPRSAAGICGRSSPGSLSFFFLLPLAWTNKCLNLDLLHHGQNRPAAPGQTCKPSIVMYGASCVKCGRDIHSLGTLSFTQSSSTRYCPRRKEPVIHSLGEYTFPIHTHSRHPLSNFRLMLSPNRWSSESVGLAWPLPPGVALDLPAVSSYRDHSYETDP